MDRGSPLQHTITFAGDPEDVYVTLSGETTVDGFAAYLADLLSDPRWRPGMNVLVDLTTAEDRSLGQQEVAVIAGLLSRNRSELGAGRRALVASDSLTYGITRMVQAYAEAEGVDFTMAVFRTIEEAREWLRSDDWSARAPVASEND